MNEINQDNMRTEIATLDEDITIDEESVTKTIKGKFKIPVIMTTDTVASVQTSNKNVLNRNNSNLKGSSMNLNNTISLVIPKEYIMFYNGTKIPKGSKFLVSFVSANVNDIKIIGRYDGDKTDENDNSDNLLSSYIKLLKEIDERLKKVEQQCEESSSAVSSLESSLSSLDSRISALETSTSSLNSSISTLESSISSLESRVSALEAAGSSSSSDSGSSGS